MKNLRYDLMPELFLRTPFYSFKSYDLLRLPDVLTDQVFRNALWLASPVFYQLLARKTFDFERLNDKERHTLAKYYNRMCYRPTPFGAFAGFTLLNWGQASGVRLSGAAELHLLPDQAILAQLNRLYADDQTRTLRLNPTLYRSGKTYRFIRSEKDPAGPDTFRLEAIRALPFYTQLFAELQKQERSYTGLSERIIARTGCTAQEAADHLDFLLEAQVLIGPEKGNLSGSTRELSLQTLPIETPLPDYAGTWLAGLPLLHQPESACFYTALERPLAAGRPDEQTRAELGETVRALDLLSAQSPSGALQEFTAAFSARYDRARIPLMQALDPEGGLSYAGLGGADGEPSLLENIRFAEPENPAPPLAWEKVRQLLFRLWQEAGPGSPLLIQAADLAELDKPEGAGAAPSTLAVIFRHTEEQLLVEHVGGASAGALTGRFSVFSQDAHRLCVDIARQEQEAHPDILFADVILKTGTSADNINRRCRIYPYEIPVNVFSASNASTLNPADLLLSVQQGQLILESASKGKRVIPRHPTAFNFRRNELPLYRFLCDLQYQGLSAPRNLDLEQLFPGLPAYPRVVYAHTIIHLAKWKITRQEIFALTEGRQSIPDFRSQRHLARRISMGLDDQQLVFDLAQAEEAVFFIACLKNLSAVTLQEYILPDRGVREGLEPMAGQFVAFLSHQEPVYQAPGTPTPMRSDIRRRFSPGSEWLYLKCFCTPRAADELLTKLIRPLIRRSGKKIHCWFFIRYNEGGPHLRLRFRADADFNAQLLRAIDRKISSAEREYGLHDLQTATYQRELERYDPDLITETEQLFQAGSELVISFLSGPACSVLQLAWITAMRMTGVFFGEAAQAITFSQRMNSAFLQEFGGGKNLGADLDAQYRKYRQEIGQTLSRNLDKPMKALLEQLEHIHRRTGHYPAERKQRLLGDLIHMQLNRTFREEARKQELLIYHFLSKHLASLIARDKRKEDH